MESGYKRATGIYLPEAIIDCQGALIFFFSRMKENA
jgi:hypothetical protein